MCYYFVGSCVFNLQKWYAPNSLWLLLFFPSSKVIVLSWYMHVAPSSKSCEYSIVCSHHN